MEDHELAGSSKEKKYVLYTVVGEEKPRKTAVTVVRRVVIGCCMLAALAVVPYMSLRLAQANAPPVVVYQHPGLVNNHRAAGHRQVESSIHRKQNLMESDSLTLHGHIKNKSMTITTGDTNSTSRNSNNVTDSPHTLNISLTETPTTNMSDEVSTMTIVLEDSDTSSPANPPDSESSKTDGTVTYGNTLSKTSNAEIFSHPRALKNISSNASKSTSAFSTLTVTKTKNSTEKYETETHTESISTRVDSESTFVTTNTKKLNSTLTNNVLSQSNIVRSPISMRISKEEKVSTTVEKELRGEATKLEVAYTSATNYSLPYELVYVATAISGTQIAGVCMWKNASYVTKWKYFYENLPVELQSPFDNADHELRATLAAVRTFSDEWRTSHVVLRATHHIIEQRPKVDTPPPDTVTKSELMEELRNRSKGSFTYDLEWRLPEEDRILEMAYSLAELNQNYVFWRNDFVHRMRNYVGKDDGNIVQEFNDTKLYEDFVKNMRVRIAENVFFTRQEMLMQVQRTEGEEDSSLTAFSKKRVQQRIDRFNKIDEKNRSIPLNHKLVYVATAASGPHVGGFCVWKLDSNVTDWAFFYDNVPVEYQGNHDSVDHDYRAILVAVRVWGALWKGAHVTIRSPSALGPSSPVLTALHEELKRQGQHSNVDLQMGWRKSEYSVQAAFSLSRLNRNYSHWLTVFKGSVDNIMGPQNWTKDAKAKRVQLLPSHFFSAEDLEMVASPAGSLPYEATIREFD